MQSERVMRETSQTRNLRQHLLDRRGFTLVWCAGLMVVMVGMTGLVLDSGLMWASHRQSQNAADAAALASAMDKLRGQSDSTATTTATTFVKTHNGLASATVTVNIPPTTGPYAGAAQFVEVLVQYPVQTAFIQVLGVNQSRTVTGRAVAGYQAVTAGEGVAVLDPQARPGLDVSGGGKLSVFGRIIVNSEGGGVDENGLPINNGNTQWAAKGGQPNSATGIYASVIDVVGGVDDPASFKAIVPGDPSPLACRALPEVDPLINLPTPTTAIGAVKTPPQKISVTNNGFSPDPPQSPNYYDAVNSELVIFPGSFESISITGGKVKFMPGIYVIKWKSQGGGDSVQITGGTVTAEGIMFYHTGHNFNEDTGTPDLNDGDSTPPPGGPFDGANFGSFVINAGIKLSPIDTTKYTYANPNIFVFNGMLMYQRRWNVNGIDIQGASAAGVLSGTMYAKWAQFKLSGQGTYSAQFVIGSLNIPGQGNVTLNYAGKNLGKANQVFLVE